METVGSRLRKLIDTEEDSLRKFCDKYGFEYNSIQPITKDKRELGGIILRRLVEQIPGLNSHWLLFGEGNMKFSINDESTTNNRIEEPTSAYSDPLSDLILQAISNKRVENKINEMIENKMEEMKFKFQFSEEGSEFEQRLEAIMQREAAKAKTDQKRTTKKPKDV